MSKLLLYFLLISMVHASLIYVDNLLISWKDDKKSVSVQIHSYERVLGMNNLSEKSVENVEFMIEAIKEKLKVLNLGAIKPSHFDEEMYEELKDIYDLVMKKDSFSPNEMQALVEELGSLRKNK